jgi:hypothetical protein
MCGLFGYACSKPIGRLPQVIIQLALENESRGRVSFGWSDGKRVVKDMGTISRKLYQLPLKTQGTLIGHTRAPTVGAHIVENTHPFEYKDKFHVIGAHNGSIYNYDALNKKYERDLKVDSMQIFKHISEGLPLDELEGSGAVTFIKDGELCISRFNGGLLSVARLDDVGGIVWSSLQCDLEKVLQSANLKYTMYTLSEGLIYFLGKDDKLFNSKDTIKIRTSQTGRSQRRTGGGYHYGQGYQQQSSSNQTTTTRTSSSATKGKRVIRLRVQRHISDLATDKQNVELQAEHKLHQECLALITNDKTISILDSPNELCSSCKDEHTNRKLVHVRVPICLKCLCVKVLDGSVVAPHVLKSLGIKPSKEDTAAAVAQATVSIPS